MKKNLLYGLCIVVTAAVAGCGGQRELPLSKTVPVRGKITIKGEPVAFATVSFEPKDGKGAEATAYTDKDGVFSGARTYSNSEMDGMVPGEYELKLGEYNTLNSVTFFGARPGEGEKPTKIPPEYQNSGQTVTVEASGDNDWTIDLK